jgi:hypothetical protein
MIYPQMQFTSEVKADKYAKRVLGHQCFASLLTDEELMEKQKIEKKFSKSFI